VKIKICEIFESIQGESSFAGFPFFFIRISGCNLRCSYCDSVYAYEQGREIKIERIIEKASLSWINNILLTGGEPLYAKNIYALINGLIETRKKILIETNGSILIDRIPQQVIKILDFKTPSSGMAKYNEFKNINYLNFDDEVKFVISDFNDFQWSCNIIEKYDLFNRINNIIFSPVTDKLASNQLAHWILGEKINARLQLQLHKYINMK